MKNLAKILIPLIVVLAAFVAVEFLYRSSQKSFPGALPAEEAAQKAMSFINDIALQGQSTASLLETVEESGLYRIRIKIQDQEYESYVTKDGKILFAQGTKIAEPASAQQDANQQNTGAQEFTKSDIPQVQLFVMSFCPYGNQAEDAMIPVVNLLKDKANIELHYVIYSNYQGGGETYCLDKENKYCSMHGISEVHQDIRESCVQKYQKDKFWNFVNGINNTCAVANVDTCWEGVAQKLGIDIGKVKTCQKNEGLSLVGKELELGQKYGIQGSPQLIINGTEYTGERTAEAFKKAICSAFNSQPAECSQTLSTEGGSVSGGCE